VQGYGLVSVSLYDTLGPDACSYIINHASLSIIFTTPEKIPGLLKRAKSLKALKVIVSLDPIGEKPKELLKQWATEKGIEIYDFEECGFRVLLLIQFGGIERLIELSCFETGSMGIVESLGRANPLPIIPAVSSQIATICYTSVRNLGLSSHILSYTKRAQRTRY
jgi:long-chain acyl-CoA synthetase